MLFGAGIWLVAQIYHIDAHYPNAYFIWGIGALSLAWVMPSISQGFISVFLMFLWGWFEMFDFHHPNYMGSWIVLLGLIPLAWLQRSRALLFFSLIAFVVLYCFSILNTDEDLTFTTVFFNACLYLAVGRLAKNSDFAKSAPLFTGIGYAVYLVLLFIFSFPGTARELMYVVPQGGVVLFCPSYISCGTGLVLGVVENGQG